MQGLGVIAQCLISFGSNLGDRDARIAEAARMIERAPRIDHFRASRLYETPPIGGPGGQQPFLNAVAAFETTAPAREILQLLQLTEDRLGRHRRHRWGARSIDLDVVLHGELIGGGTGLVVPHPRYTARQFVLQPACDVAPHYRDPRFGWTLRRLARHLREGLPSLAIVGGEESTRIEICRRLQQEHGIRTFTARSHPSPRGVVANTPAPGWAHHGQGDPADEPLEVETDDGSWVSSFVPPLPPLESDQTARANVPRLLARLQYSTAATRWPAPHQIWPSGRPWPEYRLEIDDLDWAIGEVVSALDSMRCPVEPVTPDDRWWH